MQPQHFTKTIKPTLLLLLTSLCLLSCTSSDEPAATAVTPPPPAPVDTFYYGADLSYVNEMEDCGAVYKNQNDSIEDPYKIFADAGANLVRVRLWYNPTWTDYSDLEDVKKTITRAKTRGMGVLLDFQYSDT